MKQECTEVPDSGAWPSGLISPGEFHNSMRTVNFQMFKLDIEKAEEPEIKLPTSVRSSKK